MTRSDRLPCCPDHAHRFGDKRPGENKRPDKRNWKADTPEAQELTSCPSSRLPAAPLPGPAPRMARRPCADTTGAPAYPRPGCLALLDAAAILAFSGATAHAEKQPRPIPKDTGLSVTIAKTVSGYVKTGGGCSDNTGLLNPRSWLPFLITFETCRASLIDEFTSTLRDAGLGSALPTTRSPLPDGATYLNVNVSETYITVACHKLR